MRSLVILALAALTGAAPAAGQVSATLRGVVRSALTGEPIRGAFVQVIGTNVATETNDEGRYALLSLPIGVSVIRITHGGHVTVSERVAVERAALFLHDFEMMAPEYVLDELVARAMRPATEVPDQTIRGAEVTKARGGIHDVLDAVSGVTLVRTGGAVGMGYTLRVRGAKSITFDRRPVIFVDGVRIDGMGSGDGMDALELISSGTIARIQILKGAAADVKYGPDAVDGVVVISTRRGGNGS